MLCSQPLSGCKHRHKKRPELHRQGNRFVNIEIGGTGALNTAAATVMPGGRFLCQWRYALHVASWAMRPRMIRTTALCSTQADRAVAVVAWAPLCFTCSLPGRLPGWLPRSLPRWLPVGSLIGCPVRYRVGCLVDCLVGCLVGYLVGYLAGYTVACHDGCLPEAAAKAWDHHRTHEHRLRGGGGGLARRAAREGWREIWREG